MKALYIEKCENKEKTSTYFVLKADLGFGSPIPLSFESDAVLKITDMPYSKLCQMKVGDKINLTIDKGV